MAVNCDTKMIQSYFLSSIKITFLIVYVISLGSQKYIRALLIFPCVSVNGYGYTFWAIIVRSVLEHEDLIL